MAASLTTRTSKGAALSWAEMDANLNSLNGAIIAAETKLNRIVQVTDYGAIGNGTTDDTAAIQAAVDALTAGDALDFLDLTYRVTSVVELSGSSQNKTGLTFIGRGATIQLDSAVTDNNVAEIVSGANYRVSGIHFKGNKGTVTTPGTDASYRYYNGLYVGAVTGKTLSKVIIEGCRFSNCAYDGIMLGSGPVSVGNILPGVDHVSITGCSLFDNEAGLSGGAYRNVTISGNTFSGNDIYGVLVDADCVDVTVSGNTFDTGTALGSTNANIFLYDAQRVTVSGNATNGGKTGILVSTGCTDWSIVGNTVANAAASGIAVSNSTAGTISGNTVVSAGNYGITLASSASQISISGNTARSSGYDGIYLSSASSVMVEGNLSIANNGSGIYALSSTWVSLVGNLCLNNNVNSGDAVSSGIRLNDSTKFNVIGNRCFDSASAPSRRQLWGVSEEGTSDLNIYVANDFSDNKTAATNLIGTGNVYGANGAGLPQFRSQNGTAALPAYSFVGNAATGVYRTSGGNLGFSVNGELQGLVQVQAGAVNYPVLRGSSTTAVSFFPDGTDTNIALEVSGKGTGGVRVAATGQAVGFLGTTPAAKKTVSGAKGSNAALGSLLTALSDYGLITDSTSA